MPADPPDDGSSAAFPMPQLSDDAVVQIHDFIAHFLDVFEARYGDQIHCYAEDRWRDTLWEPQDPPDWGDMPF